MIVPLHEDCIKMLEAAIYALVMKFHKFLFGLHSKNISCICKKFSRIKTFFGDNSQHKKCFPPVAILTGLTSELALKNNGTIIDKE